MPLVATMQDTGTGGGYFTGVPCASVRLNGKPVAIVGSTFYCTSHSTATTVIQGARINMFCNIPAAYHGCLLGCGHTVVVNSQTHWVVQL